MKFLSKTDVETIINQSSDSKNNRFLKSSHNLWIRFHNYEKQLPMALMVKNKPVCIHFATFNKNAFILLENRQHLVYIFNIEFILNIK